MTELPGPNEEVLEAQARVCTGPHQTRPLGKRPGDPDPGRVLELIVQSERGKLGREAKVSRAQMGAFFAAMTIRKGFGKETAWSEAEMGAMETEQDVGEHLLRIQRERGGQAVPRILEKMREDGRVGVHERGHRRAALREQLRG